MAVSRVSSFEIVISNNRCRILYPYMLHINALTKVKYQIVCKFAFALGIRDVSRNTLSNT